MEILYACPANVATGGTELIHDIVSTLDSLDGVNAKILYMAPVFYGAANPDKLSDENYDNPIEAFEAGYFYAKEADR